MNQTVLLGFIKCPYCAHEFDWGGYWRRGKFIDCPECGKEMYVWQNIEYVACTKDFNADEYYAMETSDGRLSINELQNMPLHEWVWIEVLAPFESKDKISAYYRKQVDYSRGMAFCCGYPGLSFSFDYNEYGKSWVAYSAMD
jgi:hypothetical protein